MSSIKQQTDQYAASTSSAATAAAAAAAYQAAPATSSHSYPSSDLPQYRMYSINYLLLHLPSYLWST